MSTGATPRGSTNRTSQALVLALVLLAATGSPAAAPRQPSGADVLALCGGLDTPVEPSAACLQYFRATLRRVAGRAWRPGRAACPPAWFGPRAAAGRFRSESELFPEVLQTPADLLVEGMLLKFFPCTGV